jgi:hypothetical protein
MILIYHTKNTNYLLIKGVLVGLENSGSHERMNTKKPSVLAGTCAAYGLDKRQVFLQHNIKYS